MHIKCCVLYDGPVLQIKLSNNMGQLCFFAYNYYNSIIMMIYHDNANNANDDIYN